MKYYLILIFLFLGGCATIIPAPHPVYKSYPMKVPLPVCREGQIDDCRKLDASDLGGTARGYNEN